jgi:hypothetical protein
VQEIQGRGGAPFDPAGDSRNLVGVWGSPAYWNGNVYFGSATKDDPCHNPSTSGCPISDYLKTYSFNAGGSGVLSTYPTSHTYEQFSWPAPSPYVSSNGASGGIVWAIENNNGTGILHANDATNLANELYNGILYPGTQAPATKFSVPTVANGKVYVGGKSQLTAYGLVSPPWVFSTGLLLPAPMRFRFLAFRGPSPTTMVLLSHLVG